MKTFENEVDEIANVVIKLTWTETVFKGLFEKGESHRKTREMHPELFLTMYESLLSAFSVGTAVLFDDASKATSMPNLIAQMEVLEPQLAQRLRQEIQQTRQSIRAIEQAPSPSLCPPLEEEGSRRCFC